MPNQLPGLIAHADWSVTPAKRWLALAVLNAGRYQAQPPQEVGDVLTLSGRLRTLAGADSAVLLGVDFPIGLPLAYAELAGVDDFAGLLPQLGHGLWQDFYAVAERPEQISLRRPFYPQRPDGAQRNHLMRGLGLTNNADLLRLCDQPQSNRPAAAPLFWTLGGQQVGKAALNGWKHLLTPGLARDEISLWPFHGPLAELLQTQRIVVAETYPAECYRHLGVSFAPARPGVRSGKRVQEERAGNSQVLLSWASAAGVDLEQKLQADIADGFGASSDGEDRFDAVVGLFGLLNIVLGRRPPGEPTDPVICQIEGWILGQTENEKEDKQDEFL